MTSGPTVELHLESVVSLVEHVDQPKRKAPLRTNAPVNAADSEARLPASRQVSANGFRKVQLSVCDARHQYTFFEAELLHDPQLREATSGPTPPGVIAGLASQWEPLTIRGGAKLREHIRNSTAPLRIAFEHMPPTTHWWEIQDAFPLPGESNNADEMTFRFYHCARHSYGGRSNFGRNS